MQEETQKVEAKKEVQIIEDPAEANVCISCT
jgi:hypothetical protein